MVVAKPSLYVLRYELFEQKEITLRFADLNEVFFEFESRRACEGVCVAAARLTRGAALVSMTSRSSETLPPRDLIELHTDGIKYEIILSAARNESDRYVDSMQPRDLDSGSDQSL
jgi:hypothetical protein